ncbi:MAG: family 43 glycosylhydrolase [Candidatus Eisenbacteria bacterium]|nr:family 43 glycosylhydrolase [Candidatus Eisenbacteria bacterium]
MLLGLIAYLFLELLRQEVALMRRARWYLLALMLLFATGTSSALQLRWSTGGTNLAFTAATRCTLIVQADSAETGLPSEWRLLWLADSSGVSFVAMGPSLACEATTAQVSTIEPPATPADSAANLITARFCSSGQDQATEARWVLDQPGGSRCRFKVVAIDPGGPDSSRVVASNEVTCNGGVGGQYFPTILRVRSDHSTTVLRVDVVGSSLEALSSVSVSAPQLGGKLPLALVTRTDTALSASADIRVPLPTSQVRFTTPEREFPLGEIPADQVLATTLPYRWVFRDQDSFVYPKDFAFINAPLPINGEWQNLYHLYYIRHYTDGGQRRRNEFALGHAWSRDLEHWSSNPFAFVADTLHPAQWDGAEVWAPSIVQAGGMYHMFYTGLDSVVRDQTIGYATAASLDTTDLPGHWTRRTSPTLTPANASNWVHQGHDWQFRDPFVMADPEDPSRHLLFYAARMQVDPAHLAVGLFQSLSGDLDNWTNLNFYEQTTYANNGVARLESPHVFPDGAHHQPGQSTAATWRLMCTDGGWTTGWQRAVLFNNKVVGAPLTDTRAVSWLDETGLGNYLGFTTSSPEYGVQASEILQIGGTYYWGGYNGDELVFRKLNWGSPPTTDFTLEDVDFLAVDQPDLPVQVRLRLAELRLGQSTVRFRIELPAPMRAEFAVYDVMGRLVRRLEDKPLAAGASEVTWDGRDRSGAVVGSGVYFARLRAGSASQVVRVPLVR